ncbi:vitamin K-dependent gamma-carboxylase-like protein [Actinomycetospora succinea]|uniref:Vitamin K-dependent gamma-carboxylase-like protein n=1 Tax=Actinomycetospora succinea TaxID=663603 RepID=A0A4R6VL48_9PSEU|nr:HTTM domain-containing protein [Actinomycetospora succinea]TDQ62581.1 vitamin K-dependent gamma-carboxylase-like protein [Actinomycetospora succinea]
MTAPFTRLRDGWDRFWFAPRSTAPVEVLRIGFGLVATVWMLSLVPVLDPFFGNGGVIPTRMELPFGGWTLFTLVQGSPLIWVLWLAGLLGAVALTVGFQTRVAALAVFVVMMSVTRTAPLAFNAGDGLIRLVAFYMVLMPAGSAASVDRWRADPAGMWTFPHRAPWALRLAQIQLSVIYISTVWEKAGGALWRDGTAVSYAVRIGEVSRLPVPSFVTNSPLFAELATYGTLAAELAIGILVWNRAARPWVLALGVLLHLSIELTLAVGFFSSTIVTLYLAFLPPERAEQVLWWARNRVCRLIRRHPPEPSERSVPVARGPVEAGLAPVAVGAGSPELERVEGRSAESDDGQGTKTLSDA